MKLSVIIPLYNKEAYIERCINSLLEQDLTSNQYEIIIIDDGSTDSGAEKAKTYADKHLNIHFFRQQNRGVSVARNKGFDLAKGDYVYFLDADDCLVSDILRILVRLCYENDLDILEFKTKEIKDNEPTNTQTQIPKNISLSVLFTNGLSYIAEYGLRPEAWHFFVKRSFLIDNGIKFLEDTFYEDVLFTATMVLKAKRISKLNYAVHRYAVVPNSIVTKKSFDHQLKMANSSIVVVEKFQDLIGNVDPSSLNYNQVVNLLKDKQHFMVFSLFIRTLRYNLYDKKDLNKIIDKFKNFDIYPMSPKVGGGIQRLKSRFVLPIFNNKVSLFLALKVRKFVSFS